jgi:hypothetical protein
MTNSGFDITFTKQSSTNDIRPSFEKTKEASSVSTGELSTSYVLERQGKRYLITLLDEQRSRFSLHRSDWTQVATQVGHLFTKVPLLLSHSTFDVDLQKNQLITGDRTLTRECDQEISTIKEISRKAHLTQQVHPTYTLDKNPPPSIPISNDFAPKLHKGWYEAIQNKKQLQGSELFQLFKTLEEKHFDKDCHVALNEQSRQVFSTGEFSYSREYDSVDGSDAQIPQLHLDDIDQTFHITGSLQSQQDVLIPMHTLNHYVLFHIRKDLNSDGYFLEYYDSYGEKLDHRALHRQWHRKDPALYALKEAFIRIIRREADVSFEEFNFRGSPHQEESNSFDCGLFTLAYADHAFQGKPLAIIQSQDIPGELIEKKRSNLFTPSALATDIIQKNQMQSSLPRPITSNAEVSRSQKTFPSMIIQTSPQLDVVSEYPDAFFGINLQDKQQVTVTKTQTNLDDTTFVNVPIELSLLRQSDIYGYAFRERAVLFDACTFYDKKSLEGFLKQGKTLGKKDLIFSELSQEQITTLYHLLHTKYQNTFDRIIIAQPNILDESDIPYNPMQKKLGQFLEEKLASGFDMKYLL